MGANYSIDPLIASLNRREPLCRESVDALQRMNIRTKVFRPNEDIVMLGTQPNESCFVLTGFAARAQYLHDGSRQLDAVHITGDFVDLHSIHLKLMDHSVAALGPCTAAYIPHRDIITAAHAVPQLTWLLWQITVMDAAISRAWITSLGRRSAEQNLAHLLCEMYVRLKDIGQVEDDAFIFPATQGDIGDMLGLSAVHVNRTFKDLRKQDLVHRTNSKIAILDIARLIKTAGFDGTYLLPGRSMPSQPPRL